MRFKLLSLWITTSLIAGLFIIAAPASAATANITTFQEVNVTPGTCANFYAEVNYTATGTVADWSIRDYLVFAAVDANGIPLEMQLHEVTVGTTISSWGQIRNGRIRHMTARPITVRLYDVPDLPLGNYDTMESYNVVNTYPVIATMTFDPVDYVLDGSCSELPYHTGAPMNPLPSTVTEPAISTYATTPQYKWELNGDAEGYRLQVEDANGTLLIDATYDLDVCDTTDNCYVSSSTELTVGSSYRARIQTINGSGTTWSVWTDFQVITDPPYETSIIEPIGTVNSTQPTYSWYEVGGTSYRLLVTDESGETTLIDETYEASICPDNTCSVTPNVTLANGTYTVLVEATNSGGSVWSMPETFTVQAANLPAPTITAPVGSIGDTTPAYTWNVVNTATSYRLVVRNSNNITILDNTFAAVDVCSGSTCSVSPVNSLALGAAYSAVIQASNTGGNSAWSNAAYFTVTLAAPTVTSPSATIVDSTPTYTWGSVAGATAYQLYVFRTDNNSTVIDTVVTTTSFTQPDALESGVYYGFFVQAQQGDLKGLWSSAMYFRVGTAVLTQPQGEISGQPVFEWTEISDAADYRLYVFNTSENSATVFDQEVIPTCHNGLCSYNPNLTLSPAVYGWFVQPQDSTGNGAWSTPLYFTVPLGIPLASTPNSTILETQPTFSWSTIAGATQYRLYVAPIDNVGVPAFDQTVTPTCNTTCSYTPAINFSPDLYLWFVMASNGSVSSNWSNVVYFTVNVQPPTLISPNSITLSNTFQWTEVNGATEYWLYLFDSSNGTPVFYGQITPTCSSGTCETTLANPAVWGNYGWFVLSKAANVPGSWSAPLYFTYGVAPANTTLIEPANGTEPAANTYRWTVANNATAYRLLVVDSNGEIEIDVEVAADAVCNDVTCEYFDSGLPADAYRAWVLPSNDATNGTWSPQHNFTVFPPEIG